MSIKHLTLSALLSFLFLNLFAQQTANNYIRPNDANFTYGSNMGFYNNGWLDPGLANILKNAGGNTLRAALPEKFLREWGYTVRLNTFKDYVEKYGMREITVFVEGPSETVRDRTKFSGCTSESKVFANLYEPIWKSDGIVNTNNHYANYIYQTVKTYGQYVRYWEVWNEPDYTYNDPNQWFTRNPYPCEMPNLNAPITHYIRMLRITYEIIKKLDPNDYVTTGGIGYPSFLDAVLRNTDNPDGGSVTAAYPNKGGAYFDVLSYHFYPIYSLRSWDNSISNFKYSRYSDQAVQATLNGKKRFEEVLIKHGYGSTYPTKPYIITESNVSRKTFDWRYGSDEMQKNYVMKMAIMAQKNNIHQIDFFALGEGGDYATTTEYNLMGFYENLHRDRPGSEKLTASGKGYKILGQLLSTYTFNTQLTNSLAMPETVEGGTFKNNAGEIMYVLWAKTKTDQSESASANYKFPSSLNLGNLKRYDWDYSITNKVLSNSANDVLLNGSPSFFVADGTLPPINITITAPSNLTTALSTSSKEVELKWLDNALNEEAYEIYKSENGGEYRLIATVGTGSTTYLDPSVLENATLKYKVRAKSGLIFSLFSNETSLVTPAAPSPPASASAYKIYINFAPSANASGIWNNATKPKNGLVFSNFKNDKLENTTVGLTVTSGWDSWWNAANNNGLWSDALYPASVTNTTWSVNNGSQSFKLTGLSTANTYSLSFFSSLKLSNIDGTSKFTVNGQTVSINAYNNADKLITINNLKANAQGELSVVVSNANNGNAVLNALILNAIATGEIISPPPPVETVKTQVKINFNGNTWNAASSDWNNLSASPTANFTLSNLKDDKLQSTPLKITLVNAWSAHNDFGFTTGNNTGIYPDNVVKTFYYDNGTSAKQIKISGLETNKKYNFIFFASWKNPWSKAISTYTIGNKTVALDPANNQTEVVRIDEISGDTNGEAIITIQKQAGSSYSFINSLIIESYAFDGTTVSNALINNEALMVNQPIEEPPIVPYPNPFTDRVFINLNQYAASKSEIKLDLLDLGGRVLKTQHIITDGISSAIEINFQEMGLVNGMYLIRLSGKDIKSQTFKIIKN